MDEEVKIFYEYIKDLFAMEDDSSEVINLIPTVIDDFKKEKSLMNINEKSISKKLSKYLDKDVNCEDYGIANVGETYSACLKKRLFGTYKIDLKQLSESLSTMVFQHTSKKLKKLDTEYEKKNGKLPKYLKSFLTDLEESDDDDLRDEFATKVKLCESMKEVVSVCDKMKEALVIKKLSNAVDELSDSVDDLKSRINDLEYRVDDINNKVQ